MKANVEINEPVIRPVAVQSANTRTVRNRVRGFVPARVSSELFHAWRA